MRYKKILLITAYIFSVNILGGQNLSESLGGIKTNFQIYSDTADLKVSDQIIVLRAEKRYSSDSNFGTGWGFGYQSFHLEFITKKDIKIESFKYRSGRDNETRFELVFYDSQNNVLATSSSPYHYVDLLNNSSITDSPFFYSIDLIDIPIVLLDKTVKINMIKMVAEKQF